MKGPLTFRKLPVEFEAIRWTGKNMEDVAKFMGTVPPPPEIMEQLETGEATLNIETLEGEHIATIGDWIIRGVAGEYYPCKPDIFAQTYETV